MLIDIDRRLSFTPAPHVPELLQLLACSQTGFVNILVTYGFGSSRAEPPPPSAVESGLGSSYEISKVSDPSSSLTLLT